MDTSLFVLKKQFPDLSEEILMLALDIFLYQQKKQTNKEASPDDVKTFFRQFISSQALNEWLLDVDVAILKEIRQ